MPAVTGSTNQLHFLSIDALAIAEREDLSPPEGRRKFRVPTTITDIPFVLAEATATPEKRLLVAVLDDAIMTILRYANATDRRGVRLREETLVWMRGQYAGGVTFEQCCAALGCDPDVVENGVMRTLNKLRVSGESRTYKRAMHLVEGDR